MRWESLERKESAQGLLPGMGEVVARTFDVPEALGIRFHEVQARSGLNRVPKRSRMPFRWTINPYRGCTHACVYCLDGDTPILLANGRHKALAEIVVGDRVMGTERTGAYRRYLPTQVLAHWRSRNDAFLISLADGTELVASGDHRFLTERGWKYVAGTTCGNGQRPHLTTNNKLVGVGGFSRQPVDSHEYRRGYLCGMLRGDATWGSYRYDGQTRGGRDHHRFRLALADGEALDRTKVYLADYGPALDEYQFQPATSTRREIRAIRSSRRADVDVVRRLVEWPSDASDDWTRGFLAGVFDAEGGHDCAVRISNTDPSIIEWTARSLRRLGLRFVVEDLCRPNGLKAVRLTGGLQAKLRLFHETDPAITRKRSIAGVALKSDAELDVVSIEPLGTRELFDITTGTGDFIANGVVSHNCFARPTHNYLDLNAREDFEREIVVKVNVPELVRAELARASWKREHVALGTNTDPYQWAEGRYRLMEGIWEAMRDFANPCSVLTKSPLLLRDIELMKQIAERTEFVANLSIPTLEEKAWRATEPHTPHPRKRIEALAELSRAGIATGALIAPIIPGVNDSPGQIEKLAELCGEAGAQSVGGIGLHLRGEVREIWFDWLRQYRPDLLPRYEALYRRGAYISSEERDALSSRARVGRKLRRFTAEPSVRRGTRRDPPPERGDDADDGGSAGPRARQRSLF